MGLEGEGSGGRGGGKWGERGREAGIGYPPVHPLKPVIRFYLMKPEIDLQDRSRIFIYVNEAFYQNLQAPSMHITVDVLKFQTLVAYKRAKSNSADPDQTASEEAV